MMTIEEFREIHSRMQNEKPKLFQLVVPDHLATEAEIERVEQAIGVELPFSYSAFLKEFGGGSFGLTIVFSVDSGGDYYLLKRQAEASGYLPSHLLAFSDDYAGGVYVLKVEGGKASDSVFYWNQDGGLVSTPFSNVLEFVVRYAYRSA